MTSLASRTLDNNLLRGSFPKDPLNNDHEIIKKKEK